MKQQQTANIIGFYDLSDSWRKEAIDNLGELAKDAYYLEPIQGRTPSKHCLVDLTKMLKSNTSYEGMKYNAYIPLPDNNIMLLNVDDDVETASYIYV